MWLIYASLASAFWGLTYVLNEQVFKQISVPTTLAINGFLFAIVTFFIALYMGTFKADLATLSSSSRTLGLVAAGAAAIIIAEIFISLSITQKNATLAGLVEITYPLFIALFAYLLFKEGQLTLPVAMGGILILAGVFVIYWFAR